MRFWNAFLAGIVALFVFGTGVGESRVFCRMQQRSMTSCCCKQHHDDSPGLRRTSCCDLQERRVTGVPVSSLSSAPDVVAAVYVEESRPYAAPVVVVRDSRARRQSTAVHVATTGPPLFLKHRALLI